MKHFLYVVIIIGLFMVTNYSIVTNGGAKIEKKHGLITRDLHLEKGSSSHFENILYFNATINSIKNSKFETPTQWGENVNGVIRKFSTDKKIIALTFDACGGEWGSGYDEELISYLVTEKIPATLFINSRWIDANLPTFLELASQKLFQIENHGSKHRPLSLTGGTAWGIKGTSSVEEVLYEVTQNFEKIKSLTGHSSRYFRSGTAYYDEVSVKIVEELGMKVVNYDILGDAGATYSPIEVKNALLSAKNGSIVLLHMNHPSKGTAEGVKMAIPILKERGFTFVTLSEGFELENQNSN